VRAGKIGRRDYYIGRIGCELKTVLSLCDRTGVFLRPWAEAGYRCIAVDIQHKDTIERDGIMYVGADVRAYALPPGEYAFCAAFPPCTDLASSGARWFADKGLARLGEALITVAACHALCEATGAPYFIENPVGRLSTCWRPFDYSFDPCEYGGYLDPPGGHYMKRTCLWAGNGFKMPVPRPVPADLGSMMHLMSPSADRADKRSVTPAGFARAVFEANHRCA